MTRDDIKYILETTGRYSSAIGEITIVGGAAIMLLFKNSIKTTEDIDVLTKIANLDMFGLSTMVNNIEHTFGKYKNDRISLPKIQGFQDVCKTNQKFKIFVLSKERLYVVKKNSGRIKDLEDCKWLMNNANLNWKEVEEIEKEF